MCDGLASVFFWLRWIAFADDVATYVTKHEKAHKRTKLEKQTDRQWKQTFWTIRLVGIQRVMSAQIDNFIDLDAYYESGGLVKVRLLTGRRWSYNITTFIFMVNKTDETLRDHSKTADK